MSELQMSDCEFAAWEEMKVLEYKFNKWDLYKTDPRKYVKALCLEMVACTSESIEAGEGISGLDGAMVQTVSGEWQPMHKGESWEAVYVHQVEVYMCQALKKRDDLALLRACNMLNGLGFTKKLLYGFDKFGKKGWRANPHLKLMFDDCEKNVCVEVVNNIAIDMRNVGVAVVECTPEAVSAVDLGGVILLDKSYRKFQPLHVQGDTVYDELSEERVDDFRFYVERDVIKSRFHPRFEGERSLTPAQVDFLSQQTRIPLEVFLLHGDFGSAEKKIPFTRVVGDRIFSFEMQTPRKQCYVCEASEFREHSFLGCSHRSPIQFMAPGMIFGVVIASPMKEPDIKLLAELDFVYNTRSTKRHPCKDVYPSELGESAVCTQYGKSFCEVDVQGAIPKLRYVQSMLWGYPLLRREPGEIKLESRGACTVLTLNDQWCYLNMAMDIVVICARMGDVGSVLFAMFIEIYLWRTRYVVTSSGESSGVSVDFRRRKGYELLKRARDSLSSRVVIEVQGNKVYFGRTRSKKRVFKAEVFGALLIRVLEPCGTYDEEELVIKTYLHIVVAAVGMGWRSFSEIRGRAKEWMEGFDTYASHFITNQSNYY